MVSLFDDPVNDKVVTNANGTSFKYVAVDNKWKIIPNVDVYSEAEIDAMDIHPQAHDLASHTTKAHQELTDYNAEANVKHLTDVQVGLLHTKYTNGEVDTRIGLANHDVLQNPNGNAEEQHMTSAQITALHIRLHAITDVLDHSANTHKVFYSDGEGHVIELALGTDGQVLKSSGIDSPPAFEDEAAGGISQATFDAVNAFGIDNKRWKTCTLEGANPWDSINVSVFYTNTGAINYKMIFSLPVPMIIHGKNLVITRLRTSIQDSDNDDYLDRIRAFGMSNAGTQTTLLDIDHNMVHGWVTGTFTDNHADVLIGGVYRRLVYYLEVNSNTLGHFDMTALEVEYYYA